MTVCEAINKRIEELLKQKQLTEYTLVDRSGLPPSTYKSIKNGKSKNPGIVNLTKIAEAFGITVREFYNSEFFDNLDAIDDE